MLKILYVIGSLELGGAESQLTRLIVKCHEQGINCTLFVLESGGYFQNSLEKQGITVYDGGYSTQHGRTKKYLLLIRAWFRLLRIIITEKPAVLHAYLPLTNFMGATTGRLMGVNRIITSRRALGTHQERHKLWKMLDRITNKLSHCVTVNSQAVWQDVVTRDEINPAKLVLINNGLDITAFQETVLSRTNIRKLLGLCDDSQAIVMVGNLLPYKGHSIVLKALAQVILTEKNVTVFFAGEDRGIKGQLQQQARELKITDHVVFLGRRDDIPTLLSAMDIFVLASFEEGSSNALLEAMAAGLPIVATDAGGNKEALENGRAGRLIPPGNANLLASALLQLLNNEEQRQCLGELARASVIARYSMENMVSAYIKLYID